MELFDYSVIVTKLLWHNVINGNINCRMDNKGKYVYCTKYSQIFDKLKPKETNCRPVMCIQLIMANAINLLNLATTHSKVVNLQLRNKKRMDTEKKKNRQKIEKKKRKKSNNMEKWSKD